MAFLPGKKRLRWMQKQEKNYGYSTLMMKKAGRRSVSRVILLGRRG